MTNEGYGTKKEEKIQLICPFNENLDAHHSVTF